MSRPPRGPRIYTRQQGGELRHYGDFRSYGGKQEALIAEGDALATTDPLIAQQLFSDRLKQIQEQKRNKQLLGVRRVAALQEYASSHLVKKAKAGSVTDASVAANEKFLTLAVGFFGAERDVASIQVEDVQRYAEYLAALPNGRGGSLGPGTQRHYLNALSNLFRRAQAEGVTRGVNPVAALMDKPSARPAEAGWLEVWEGALLLESARTYPAYQERKGTLAGRLRSALEGWGGEMGSSRSAGSCPGFGKAAESLQNTRCTAISAARRSRSGDSSATRPRSSASSPNGFAMGVASFSGRSPDTRTR